MITPLPQDRLSNGDIKQTDMNPSTGTDTESAEQKYEADPEGPAPGIMSPAPDGGARAWLVVVGSASIFFSCLGFMNSFGVFQEYYTTNQLRGESPDKVAWIGSLMSFLQFAGGAIAGPLFDRYGTWVSAGDDYPPLPSCWVWS